MRLVLYTISNSFRIPEFEVFCCFEVINFIGDLSLFMTKTILLIDGEELVRKFMRRILEFSGYRVLEASDESSALEQLSNLQPDLVVMDISAPVKAGFEFCRRIRQSLQITPIICTTAGGNIITGEAAEAGCTELIDKPFNVENFNLLIKKYLE